MGNFTRTKSERIGDTLAGIEHFVATVAAGSFAGGATTLGVTASAVSRRVAALEDEVGVQLLTRTTRSLRLTADGAAFYERCTRILGEIREARDAFARVKVKPSGLLRVDAPTALGRVVLAPSLPAFLAKYPEIDLHLTLRDHLVDPIAEGIDVLVRVGPLQDSSLIATRLGDTRIVHCAAPKYLDRRGVPHSPDDLRHHECLHYLRGGAPSRLHFDTGAGLAPMETFGPFSVNDADVLLRLTKAGHGIAAFFDFLVREEIARGELRAVLEPFSTNVRPIHALHPTNRHLLPKVRALLDHLSRLFRPRSPRAGS